VIAAAAIALVVVPAAWAQGGQVTVGYRTPAALRGLEVVQRVDSLHVAEVRTQSVAKLRRRPGIGWVRRTAVRDAAAEPALVPWTAGAAPEWQWTATRCDLVPAWVQRAAAGITIAVVDTGADVTAPDLATKGATLHNVVTQGDDVTDTVGHGTFVASLAAGSVTNGDGIAGFGGDARLMVVQASRRGGTFSDVDEAAAIVWAVDNGAKIVNLSLGGPTTSRAERQAIAYATSKGVLLVAAAGNRGPRANSVEYPAALLGDSGLVVAASTPSGERTEFSSVGRQVDVAAPGLNVFGALSSASPESTFPRTALAGSSAGLYGFGSGTSYAAPQVAGAAALVWAANPSLSAKDVADVIRSTAAGGGRWTPGLGYGVIDTAAAVTRAGLVTSSPIAAAKSLPAKAKKRETHARRPARSRR
jgi:subtilisin family serine protease